jgi:hypothetical protein
VSRLTRVIAPRLKAAGLDIREVRRADGETCELVITNPLFPAWGRIVIDRDGLMEWDYWGNVGDDAGAAVAVAALIIATIAARTADDAGRHGRRPAFQPAAERNRPHPLDPPPAEEPPSSRKAGGEGAPGARSGFLWSRVPASNTRRKSSGRRCSPEDVVCKHAPDQPMRAPVNRAHHPTVAQTVNTAGHCQHAPLPARRHGHDLTGSPMTSSSGGLAAVAELARAALTAVGQGTAENKARSSAPERPPQEPPRQAGTRPVTQQPIAPMARPLQLTGTIGPPVVAGCSRRCENFLYAVKGGSLRSPPRHARRAGVRPLRADRRAGMPRRRRATSVGGRKEDPPGPGVSSSSSSSSVSIVPLAPAASMAPTASLTRSAAPTLDPASAPLGFGAYEKDAADRINLL